MFVWICLIILAEVLTFGLLNKKMKMTCKRWLRTLANVGFLAILLVTLRYVLFPPVGKMPVTGQYEITSNDYWLTEDKADPYMEDGGNEMVTTARFAVS
ncbi:hypothetical protein [Pseudobutyrivibrio xylanivorans]|uniref:Uncharacterized protein n=1 Tax=Pseudobutyrivibrio xylanivorans TaxID=185007 RepID=A0A1G5RWY4_PSEXY|nr:hypothetical protein [Pseudobutyrivibrio xylanivorans]SCZ77829.1 hypothetical protein SAMN02910350_00951 [Pseudobutyrivibrio xylanivorans]